MFTRWRLFRLRLRTSNCSLLLIYLPRKDERLSRPGWLTYSRRFTHISGHPSAVGRALDRESSPVKDQRSTAVLHNQPVLGYFQCRICGFISLMQTVAVVTSMQTSRQCLSLCDLGVTRAVASVLPNPSTPLLNLTTS